MDVSFGIADYAENISAINSIQDIYKYYIDIHIAYRR